MKKISLLIFALIFVATSCKEESFPKPNNLIPRDKMENIIYDLAILEAVKLRNSAVQNYPTPNEYIKLKYKIDSLTFAKSTQYYASDIKEYKKMYDEVKDRLTKENAKLTNTKVRSNPEIILEKELEQ
jgi:hypothetical protein